LELYIDDVLEERLPLKKFLSSKDLPTYNLSHSAWKQVIYKHASEIVRSLYQKTKRRVYKRYKTIYAKAMRSGKFRSFTGKRWTELNVNILKRIKKPEIKRVGINIDSRLFDIQKVEGEFDEFVKIRLPWFQSHKKRAQTVNLPIKHHRHSLKFSDWNRKDTIKLIRRRDSFDLCLTYEAQDTPKVDSKEIIGIDLGYKKAIVTSSGNMYGQELLHLYDRISKKRQGSKAFKRLLAYRDALINEACNRFNDTELKGRPVLAIEDLKNVKHGSKGKIHRKTMNKLQRWSYSKTISKLESLAQTEGFHLLKVDPAYTSQKCSSCGFTCKENRRSEEFSCVKCGYENDADLNAALNIHELGVYDLQHITQKTSF
jgi:IS605 OrfB family transposase